MNVAAEDDDANTREVIAGLRAQVTAVERERDTARAEVASLRAELDAMKRAVDHLSSAWRHLVKNLG
jgi:hypothetical protein